MRCLLSHIHKQAGLPREEAAAQANVNRDHTTVQPHAHLPSLRATKFFRCYSDAKCTMSKFVTCELRGVSRGWERVSSQFLILCLLALRHYHHSVRIDREAASSLTAYEQRMDNFKLCLALTHLSVAICCPTTYVHLHLLTITSSLISRMHRL
jgi:hypothetical protein